MFLSCPHAVSKPPVFPSALPLITTIIKRYGIGPPHQYVLESSGCWWVHQLNNCLCSSEATVHTQSNDSNNNSFPIGPVLGTSEVLSHNKNLDSSNMLFKFPFSGWEKQNAPSKNPHLPKPTPKPNHLCYNYQLLVEMGAHEGNRDWKLQGWGRRQPLLPHLDDRHPQKYLQTSSMLGLGREAHYLTNTFPS